MNSLSTYAKLRRIKAFREQRAAAAVTRQRALVEHRAAWLATQQRQHDSFRAQRLTRERTLFAELQGKTVQLRAIEQMNQRVALLRQREAELAEAVMQAEREFNEAKQALKQARSSHVDAARELEKMERLIAVAQRSARLEHERQEEGEIEETANAVYMREVGRSRRRDQSSRSHL